MSYLEYSLADTIAGKRGATRDDLKTIHFLIEKAKGQDYKVRRNLGDDESWKHFVYGRL